MKKICFALAALLLALQNICYSQKCKLDEFKDDFENSKTVQTKSATLAKHGTVHFGYGNDKDSWRIELIFVLDGTNLKLRIMHLTDGVPANVNIASFKFADGTVMKCANYEQAQTESLGMHEWRANALFGITKSQLAKFAQTDIVKIRMEFDHCDDHPTVEKELKDKIVEEIKEKAACLLKEVK